ncbi:MAG: ATP-binding protein [Nitrospirae bacterium]|nr:ATP-binding protein [Nitrospirota bacterium]
MNIYAVSALLNGLAATLLGGFVVLRGLSDQRHRTFGIYCFSIAIWGFFYCGWQLAETASSALIWVKICMMGAIFIPVTYFHHVLVLLDQVSRYRRILLGFYLVAGTFLLSDFTPLFIQTVEPRLSFPYWPIPGMAFHLFLLWFTGTVGFTMYLLGKAYRTSTGNRQQQYLYLLLGSVIGYVGGATNFPLWYDIPILPIGTIAITAFVSITAYSMLRYRLLDISIALEKGLAYLILLTLVTFPAYGILVLTEKIFFGYVDTTFSLLLLGVFGIIVIGAYKMWDKAQTVIAKTLFPERYDKYETLSKFSKALVTILDLQTLSEEIVNTLGKVMGVHTAVMFTKHDQETYVPVASYPDVTALSRVAHISGSSFLPSYLLMDNNIIVLEELKEETPQLFNAKVIEELKEWNASVCLPFINKNQLMGFCLLGPRSSHEMYSSQDFNLLGTLAQEGAIALDNALLYAALKQSQAAIQRTDRLRSLETMAGGMAHEIRNPLTSIKAFMQMVPSHTDDVQFLTRFGAVVAEDVARIERLTKEILEYARPANPTLQTENMNELIQSCLYTLKNHPLRDRVTIVENFAQNLPHILVDRQQIKQVLLNLLFNAYESMEPEGGILQVSTQKISRANHEIWMQIEISDTGAGIPEEDLDHVFDPFFTTKHASKEHEGTGLGLTIAHQIILEHRGYIEVDSTVGKGTTIRFTLPATGVPTESLA